MISVVLLPSAKKFYYYFFGFVAFYERALPAADLDDLLVLPSLSTFEAAVAALVLVCFAGDLVCDNALAAAILELAPVDLPDRVFDALVAAFVLVTF